MCFVSANVCGTRPSCRVSREGDVLPCVREKERERGRQGGLHHTKIGKVNRTPVRRFRVRYSLTQVHMLFFVSTETGGVRVLNKFVRSLDVEQDPAVGIVKRSDTTFSG